MQTVDRTRRFMHAASLVQCLLATLAAGSLAPSAVAGGVCPCLGDITGDGQVSGDDLAIMLGAWGPCGNCASCDADFSGDCQVNAIDLGILLGAWGPCAPVPANDLCSEATVIVNGTGGANPFCTLGASTDGPSQTCGVPAFSSIEGDVWFRFTPNLTGTMQVGVCADFDVRLAVYGEGLFGGCACPSGIFPAPLLGCAGTDSFVSCPTGAALLVPVTAGDCYTIRIGGAPGQHGSGNVDINFYVPPCEILSSTKLTAGGLEADTEFGISTDMSGDVAVSGAIFDDLLFGGASAGSARVYRYQGNLWSEDQTLVAPSAFAGQRFGISVAADGDWIAVGAGDIDAACVADPDCYTGAVHLYHNNGTDWLFDQTLTPVSGDGSPMDHFGTRVDIDGTRTLVAASNDDNANGIRAGAVYVYEFVSLFGGVWLQTSKLLAADGDNFDDFGSDVGVSGTWAVVGASNDEAGGSAYLFQDTGSSWPQKQKLHPASLPATADFGYAVAIDGSVAVVGAPDFSTGTGKAYVYENFGGAGWLLTATLTAHDGAVGDSFGASLSIAGDKLLIGAPNASSGRGAAYLYWRVNGGWVERAKLLATDGLSNDAFGGSVAIDGGLGLVGAYFDNVGLSVDVGSVYRFNGLFECTGNGVAEACDIANGVPDSDLDGIPDICEP
jgi:hypothetical protein